MAYKRSRKPRGADIDVVRGIINDGELPPERAGYILARLALAQGVHTMGSRFGVYADLAFDQLTHAHTAMEHQPPLPGDLLEAIKAYRIERRGYPSYPDDEAVLYLAAAIDHGSRETFTVAEHEARVHDSDIRLA